MGKLSLWDLLLIGLLVTPIGVGSLFLYSMWGLLTVEVVPADQGDIPVPRPGERVDVYGTWVRDRGHALGDYGWNEIHPAVFFAELGFGCTRRKSAVQPVRERSRPRKVENSGPC